MRAAFKNLRGYVDRLLAMADEIDDPSMPERNVCTKRGLRPERLYSLAVDFPGGMHGRRSLEKRPTGPLAHNLTEPYEVQYWADKFDVSKERLSEAVRKVGHSADAVAKELQKNPSPY